VDEAFKPRRALSTTTLDGMRREEGGGRRGRGREKEGRGRREEENRGSTWMKIFAINFFSSTYTTVHSPRGSPPRPLFRQDTTLRRARMEEGEGGGRGHPSPQPGELQATREAHALGKSHQPAKI
jgi:hypothetical protein